MKSSMVLGIGLALVVICILLLGVVVFAPLGIDITALMIILGCLIVGLTLFVIGASMRGTRRSTLKYRPYFSQIMSTEDEILEEVREIKYMLEKRKVA